MKFKTYLNEEKSKGWGISFVDIDETIFKTFAKINIMKDGKVIRKINNQEFNSYVLKNGETYDFKEFRNAELFNKTSIPIDKSIKRIKKMLNRIKQLDSKSRIIFLTARADFDNKDLFLKTFEEHGINMDKPNVYVERVGNTKTGTIDSKKKQVMLKYLKEGIYRRARLIDDQPSNLNALLDIRDNFPKDTEDKIRKTYNLGEDEEVIKFWALLATPDGILKEIKRK